MPECWYFVQNNRTGLSCDVIAASPAAACASRGWQLAECSVIRVTPLPDYFTRHAADAPADVAVPGRTDRDPAEAATPPAPTATSTPPTARR